MLGTQTSAFSASDAAKENRRQAMYRWLPVLVSSILVVVIIAGIASVIWADRQRAIDTWRGRVTVFTRLLASHAEQVLTGAANLTEEIANDSGQDKISSSDELRQKYKTELYKNFLAKRRRDWKDIFDVGIFDAEGNLFVASDLPLGKEIKLSNRDYFIECKNNKDKKILIGAPVQNIVNGSWHFTLCNAIKNERGEFIGAILIAIYSDYFGKYYSIGGDVGQRATVLLRDDGTILAGDVPGRRYGDHVPSALVLKRLDEAQKGLWTADPGHLPSSATLRMIGAQPVPGFPVVFGTVVPESTVLADWKSSALTLAVLAATLCAALIALAIWASWAFGLQRSLLRAQLRERAAAEEAQRTKLQFVSLVSHDLRTPLTALIASADLIDGDTPAANRKNYVDVIRTAAKYVLSLVDSILNFVSSDLKLDARKAVPFSVRQVVEDCVLMTQGAVEDKPLTFRTDIADNVPDQVLGNPGILAQILANTLGNSAKYSDAGEISVGVSLLQQNDKESRLRFVLRDAGPGIPPALLSRLFQPFVRGDTHEVRMTEGHGLGLAIVWRLVEALSGSIAVDSGRGLGTTLVIDLPFARAELKAAPPEERPAPQKPSEPRFKILLAEDAAAVRLLLKGLVEKLGHDVVAVSDGLEAVSAAKASQFDLIIMDLRMPQLDGAEATRLIRRLPAYAATPIIALTGYSEILATELFAVSGFTAHMQKPVRIDELAKLIETVGTREEQTV